ncbi:hypothetical protein BpHYR1_046023 [Brachionus plicatilis]|uniref:SWIM-type domain-containing protein n=1 Tax=Brachionus plicatilis TaxID=10195 RepID=A0A3M7Q6M7_BRAPC|nr:hypothetical protein BpHYR1_046023 [Brachionus plicatilis]
MQLRKYLLFRVLNGQIKYSVSINPKYCTCPYFLEYGICKHFISLCRLLNLQFDENDREFVQLNYWILENISKKCLTVEHLKFRFQYFFPLLATATARLTCGDGLLGGHLW